MKTMTKISNTMRGAVAIGAAAIGAALPPVVLGGGGVVTATRVAIMVGRWVIVTPLGTVGAASSATVLAPVVTAALLGATAWGIITMINDKKQ